METRFIHLSIHSEYSLVDGLISIKPLIQKAVENNYPAVALTDRSNLFAAVKFYKMAIAEGIKPIIGCHIYLENEENESNPFSLTLLCQNNQGYKNLTEIVSKSYLEGQKQGRAIVKRKWIEANNDGLIVISGGVDSDIARALLANEKTKAHELIQFWQYFFKGRYYLELQRIGHRDEKAYLPHIIECANHYALPVVATNAVCFLNQDDFEAHEARVCINRGLMLADPRRSKDYTLQQYFCSQQEMVTLFHDIPAALQNSVEIAKRCNVTLELGKYYLPDFPIPEGMTLDQYFSKAAHEGLAERLDILFADKELTKENKKRYEDRLREELNVISSMGFAGYFLIVADFILWAKKQNIPVGPGRGSGAGSLVAYALKITDLDPLLYDLLFERFLNPERVSLPDFDVDFCMEGRDKVIDYVASKYGRNSVSQIITYGTMAAKAVIRDVGRVLNHPYGFVDKIAKLIPFEIGITLDKALALEANLLERYNQEPEVTELIDLAKKLEGITRNVGKHAGGVVIAPSKLTHFCPLYCEENGSNLVTQFDKDDVETIGLVKFDFLGLRTLTIIHWAVQNINEKQTQPMDIALIPLDDEKTFDLLKACKTTAVFQLESRGMKDLIKRLQPDCFEDIVALVALFRPGPLQSGMVDDFIDRKHGRAKVEYPHKDLEPILRPTYGVILYQEQVMQIAQVLAGYTLGGADLLRRAMGKKKAEEMAEQRAIFTQGAIERGVEKETATYIFDLMEKFAGYGFNKSHSAAYALVAYQTAWLKAHYPSEFMAAVLSSDLDNTDKIVIFYEDCKNLGLTVRPPNINEGFYKFTVNESGEIRYGLGAIKGAGEAAINNIVEERQKISRFSDIFQFCRTIDLKKANKRLFEALINSGALDCFTVHRASLRATLPMAVRYAEQEIENHCSGQMDLFSIMEQGAPPALTYVDCPKWDDRQILEGEKEALGFYLSGHPIDVYEKELRQITTTTIAKLNPTYDQAVIVAGSITSIRLINTKRGDRMAFVSLDDRTGKIDVAVFSDVINENRHLLAKDQIIIVEGEVSVDDYSGGFRMGCKKLVGIEKAREMYAKNILLSIYHHIIEDDFFQQLEETLTAFRDGSCPVCVHYHNEEASAKLLFSNDWRVTPSESLLEKLRLLCGKTNVSVEYY